MKIPLRLKALMVPHEDFVMFRMLSNPNGIRCLFIFNAPQD